MNFLEKFNKFLQSINLRDYREKYSAIKIVEMNLPKEIQALELLYRIYWNKKEFIGFDEFYSIYEKEKFRKLAFFQKKTGMCKKCFDKGIKARIYRTWASIITQIHAGYVAEAVFGSGCVKMSEELDHQDCDIQVLYQGKILNYDVKKEANSGVMGRSHKPKKPIPGEKISIRYTVPNHETMSNPRKKRGEGFKKDYMVFKEQFLDTRMFEVFPNGFVVFMPTIFETKKKEINSKSK